MKGGHVVETGLTDQVLDDPQHPYTQILVSSVLQI
jgi:putative phosphonate transport system ATP-binding protein